MPPFKYFFKTLSNIILPSMPGSCKWSLPYRFPHQMWYEFLFSPIHVMCHSCLILVDFILKGVTSGDECNYSSSELYLQLSPSSHYCPLLRLKYLPQHPMVKQPQAIFDVCWTVHHCGN